MKQVNVQPVTNRPAAVIAILLVLAVLGFLAVHHLVNRFQQEKKALGRRLYERGQAEQGAGHPDRAIEDFRAALSYDHDDFQYQISLARALRDTGRTEESEAYLVNLWERAPQDGAVNLALARLFAREGSVDRAIQYYHNAIYGVWASSADTRQRDARFELIGFLLQENAKPQAQAELITLSAALGADVEQQLRVAELFERAQDYEHALAQYESVVRRNRGNDAALAGAGEAAFQLGRYRTAEGYLSAAAKLNTKDPPSAQLLQTSELILQIAPFRRHISNAERNRRIRSAFAQAGKRLESCARSESAEPGGQTATPNLPALRQQWIDMEGRLSQLSSSSEAELPDALMDLVFRIEQEAQTTCGDGTEADRALLLLSEDRGGADR